MFTVTGSTWVPKSSLEHAQDMLAAINVVIAPLGITLRAAISNVVWWICLGIGELRADYDDKLSAAKNSFDATLCDDNQILNLMPIAGISLVPASASTMVVQFNADATGQTVPAGTHVKILNQVPTFVTDADCVVSPGVASVHTLTVTNICSSNGTIVIDGVSISVTTAMNTTALVAAAINAGIYAHFTTSILGSIVTFTGITAAVYAQPTTSYASTGVTGTVATTVSGSNPYNTTTATCDTTGEIIVSANRTNGTVETLPHITSVSNPNSAITGSVGETITQARTRIITGKTIGNNLDGLAIALRSLAGIQYASVYFNPSLTVTGILNPVLDASLPPRTLHIVVKGVSTKIANTYAALSLAPTYGSQTQNYVSNSGQNIACKYDYATDAPIYVKVYVNQNLYRSASYIVDIQNIVNTLSTMVSIGQAVTQELVASAFANFTSATINGVELSLDGATYGRTAAVGAISLPVFSSTRTIAQLE
jgi:hypothetical protein